MSPLSKQLANYQAQHTHSTNKLLHYIGIPVMLAGFLILLNWVWVSFSGYWNITFAWIATIALLVYYYFLDAKLAAVMTVLLVILTLICTWIGYPKPTAVSLILFLIFFIGGIALQLIGPSFEENKSSYTQDIAQLLIAPIFVVTDIIILLGLGKHFDLQEETPAKPKNKQ